MKGAPAQFAEINFDEVEPGSPAQAGGPGSTLTGFIRYHVYECLFDAPIRSLPPPRPAVDTPELIRDKIFAAEAARDAHTFTTDTLQPLVERLYAYVDHETALPPEAARFHRTMRRTLALKPQAVETACGFDPDRVELFNALHTVYFLGAYVKRAVDAGLDKLEDYEYEAKSFVYLWNLLCGGPVCGEASVMSWVSTGATPFVRAVCELRDVVNAAQGWV